MTRRLNLSGPSDDEAACRVTEDEHSVNQLTAIDTFDIGQIIVRRLDEELAPCTGGELLQAARTLREQIDQEISEHGVSPVESAAAWTQYLNAIRIEAARDALSNIVTAAITLALSVEARNCRTQAAALFDPVFRRIAPPHIGVV